MKKTNVAAMTAGMLFVAVAGRAAAGPISYEDALHDELLAETLTDTNVPPDDMYTLIGNRILEIPEPPSGVLVGCVLAALAATKRR